MKGKVKCTCGWSWNKSDSSIKDMYICHQCGRDNSNNMKNGGSLDSYDIPQAQVGTEVDWDKVRNINDNVAVQAAKIFDPTGLSSWPDVYYAIDDYNKGKGSGLNIALNVLGALPVLGKLGKGAGILGKSEKLANAANKLSKINKAVDRVEKVVPNIAKAIGKTSNIIARGSRAGRANPVAVAAKVIGKTAEKVEKLDKATRKFTGKVLDKIPGVEGDVGNVVDAVSSILNIGNTVSDVKSVVDASNKNTQNTEKTKPVSKPKPKPSSTDSSEYEPIIDKDTVEKVIEYYNTNPVWGEVEKPGQLANVRYIPVSNSIQLKKWKEQEGKLKNGGWLDQYTDGGTMQEHQDNYNDSQASAPEGMVGDGFSNVGRNYSPAWGGQFQMGGNVYPVNYVPQAQEGIKTYSYPLRDKLYSGEEEYFKANPHVGGMAAEDNQVIINPYSPLSDEEKNAIRMNETARLAMRNGYARPTFELTPEQKEAFKNYSTDEQDQRETIIGRILSGDPSAKNVTPEQKKYAEELQKVLKFQGGGSIPGAVGFTYARTKGIPSNGPYAKKTMASAQNGKEMSYYKNGLDWKPKTISRDGSVIKDDRGQWDHPGEVTEINSNEITMKPDPKTGKPLTKPLLGISDTGDVKLMRPGGNYKFDGRRVTEYPIAQGGLTMGTTSTENDVRESSAKAAKANSEAKRKAKLEEAQLLADQRENRRNLFARDIKVKQPDGTIKIVNTGSPEYEKLYKAGEIQSADAGEGDAPYFGGELPEVVIQQQMTPLLKAKKDYGKWSNEEAFVNRKKDEYIKSLGSRGNWFGADRNNMPENVMRDINAEYDYNKNTKAIEDVAKAKGFDLNTRGNWIYNLTPGEKEALINSKYSGQLNPNEFSEMASGIQQLGNMSLPGKPLNYNIPGLTQKELEEDRESLLSPLKTFAPINLPGNAIANYLKNSSDYVDRPFLGTQRMGNVDVWDSMALNPLSYMGAEGAVEGVMNLPNTISKGAKTIGTVVGENANNIKKVIPTVKEVAKKLPTAIKNGELPETFFNAMPEEFKQTPLGQDIKSTLNEREVLKNMKKDIHKTLDVEGRDQIRYDWVQNGNDLESEVQTLDRNFRRTLSDVGGKDLHNKGISDLVHWENESPAFQRYREIIFQNSPSDENEMKALLKEIADTMPKATDYAKEAKKAITLKQKELLYNKKDVENLKAGIKATGKNVIKKIKGEDTSLSTPPVNYSPEEASTLDTIKELGKYRSLFSRDAAVAKAHPQTMENVNNLISKLDEDVVRNVLGVGKQELIDSYKNISPNVKQAEADAAMAPKPFGLPELQNITNEQSSNALRDLYLNKYEVPYSRNEPSLAAKINKRSATDKLGYEFEAPNSTPTELIHYVKTDYELNPDYTKPILDAAGNVVDYEKTLSSTGNAKGQIKKAIGIVNNAVPGENIMGSESLSTDSYALTLDAAEPYVKKGRLAVKVDPNPQRTNPMGFATRFPGLALKDINSKIEALEKASGVKIPRAKFDAKYQEYDFPKIYFTKIKKNGGYIDKAKHGNQLVKLDQLTNFTNYNKPQPGGWLSKYE